MGSKILYEEVGPKVGWDHPDNRLISATGPLAGLPVWGTGGLTVITRGALTGYAGGVDRKARLLALEGAAERAAA